MTKLSQKNSVVVSVEILDRSYQVRCKQAEVDDLQAAASHLDQQMKKARESGRNSSMERTAILVALNLANELLRTRDAMEGAQIGKTIQSINSRIGEVLDKHDGKQLELE